MISLPFFITSRKGGIAKSCSKRETFGQRTKTLNRIISSHTKHLSVEKATSIRNAVFQHLKQGNKMRIKANLTRRQMEIIKKLKEDDSIIICSADKRKEVVIEDRDVYLMKTQD